MPISLEFGRPGGLLHGIAGALSPQADPGFIGGLRSFLNPEPTLALEADQRAKLQWQQVWNRNGQNIATMTEGLKTGTPEGRQAAAQALATMTQDFTAAGFDPAPILKTYQFLSAESDVTGLRQIPADPASRLSQAGRFVTDPNQVANLARTEVQNQLTGAQTLGAEQATQQAGALFPLKQQGMTLENVLRNAQIATEGARPGLIGAQTEAAQAQGDIAQQRAAYFREHGMLPGTAGGGGATGRRPLVQGTVDPTTGMPAIYDPNIDKYYPKAEAPEVTMMREATEAVRRKNQGLPPAPAAGGPPTTPAAPPARQPLSAHELSLGQINNMSDEELGNLHINEQSLTAPQRTRLATLRTELQAILAKTPVSQRPALAAQYYRRFISEMAGEQQ